MLFSLQAFIPNKDTTHSLELHQSERKNSVRSPADVISWNENLHTLAGINSFFCEKYLLNVSFFFLNSNLSKLSLLRVVLV